MTVRPKNKAAPFLPMTQAEMQGLGWETPDIILITGDAYVDHPSFGVSIIGRYLERLGFRVGIIAQPDERMTDDFSRLGKPRLFFGITSGNVDSMIANYTANKRPRSEDDYSPARKSGLRPDRAVIVYANRIRECFGNEVPVIIGGIEASLRRVAHYDYWENKIRPSILLDSRADILVYGMGERACREIALRLSRGEHIRRLTNIRGTAVIQKYPRGFTTTLTLPAFEEIELQPDEINTVFKILRTQMNPAKNLTLAQKHADQFVIVNPPALPLASEELDELYTLPYARTWHPLYQSQGGIKGLETVRASITSHRGCAGECSFCALSFHQGRIIQSRSQASILNEIADLARRPDFHGTITDIGGPTANMYTATCPKWKKNDFCENRSCLTPALCPEFKINYKDYLYLLQEAAKIQRVKHLFIGSGLRYDLLLSPEARDYFKHICEHQISGILKVAPEHNAEQVLGLMNKPPFKTYEKFVGVFQEIVSKMRKKIFIVNYFMCAHPGETLEETLRLALYLAKRGIMPEQIQDFIPAPMTRSTAMYLTGKDPLTGKKVPVAQSLSERKMQRALIQYNQPNNRPLLKEALRKLNKPDLFPFFMKTAATKKIFKKTK